MLNTGLGNNAVSSQGNTKSGTKPLFAGTKRDTNKAPTPTEERLCVFLEVPCENMQNKVLVNNFRMQIQSKLKG